MTTRKKTVLIVDDESAQRAWMRGILRHQGCCVLEAADYTEALSVRERHDEQIDLFLIDLRLPGGSGYDLSGELLERYPGSKILFVSGTAGAELCKYFSTPLPAVQFLHKPFEAAQLASRVQEIFEDSAEPQSGDNPLRHRGPQDNALFRAMPAARKRQGKC